MSIPENPKRVAVPIPPRQSPVQANKSVEEIIKEAPLQSSTVEQTNTVDNAKPWLDGYSMSEEELMALTVKKSFNLPLLLQAKMDYYLDEQKKAKRSAARSKLNETEVLKMALNMFFKSEFKKKG